MHALLFSAGHNLRMILALGATSRHDAPSSQLTELTVACLGQRAKSPHGDIEPIGQRR
jgi:hypothetical protein